LMDAQEQELKSQELHKELKKGQICL